MRAHLLLLALSLSLAVLACQREPIRSPQELVLILETRISLATHDARVAVRVRDIEKNEALVHIECDGEEETRIARYRERTEETCGLEFEMIEYRMVGNEPSAVVLNMHFDDGLDDEEPAAEEPAAEEPAAEEPAAEEPAAEEPAAEEPAAEEPAAEEPAAGEPAAEEPAAGE